MTRRPPESVPNIADLGAALAEPTRAVLCITLLDGRAWTPTELSRCLDVPLSSVSEHVSLLIDHGLLAERRQGRHRYVQLASADTADWLEHTGALAGDQISSVPSLSAKTRDRHLIEARTCYRHLAGRLGTQLYAALRERGWVDESPSVTVDGRDALARGWGIEIDGAPDSARPLVRRCLDWTERRSHLGGRLGDVLCREFFDRAWITRRRSSRAVAITAAGREHLDWVLAAPGLEL